MIITIQPCFAAAIGRVLIELPGMKIQHVTRVLVTDEMPIILSIEAIKSIKA